MKPKSRKLDPEAAARLVQPRDTVLCGFVAGQPVGFLDALGARTDLEDVALYTGLLTRPCSLLQDPRVRVSSGLFSPNPHTARPLVLESPGRSSKQSRESVPAHVSTSIT